QPYMQGDFYSHWNVHSSTGAPALRSRFVLDVPTDVQPRITERNLNFAVKRQDAAGRRTFSWTTANVPRYRAEPFAPDTNAVQMHVITSLPLTWDGISRWYHDLSHDRYALSP